MGGSITDGANLALYRDCRRLWQRYEVKDLGSGYYEIDCANSWMALTATGTGKSGSSNVCQKAQTHAADQQWIIVDSGVGDGSYTVVSRANGLYLDVQGGHAGDSTNVWLWEATTNNSGKGQRFTFEWAYGIKGHTLANGEYVISPEDDSDQVLDVVAGSFADGADVTTYRNGNDPNQKWQVTDIGEGYYEIVCDNSQMALDVAGSGYTCGTNATQWSQRHSDNQRWIIQDTGDVDSDGNRYYSVISKATSLFLDVAGGSASNGAEVWTWGATSNNAGKGQRFAFKRMPDDGYYTVGSADDYNQELDVVASSTADGGAIDTYRFTGAINQKWHIYQVAGQYYKVVSVSSGKALDAAAGGKADGTAVTQWADYATDNQLWKIVYDGCTYAFLNKASGLYLDIAGGHAQDGARVWSWEATDNNAGRGQHWLLAKTNVAIPIGSGRASNALGISKANFVTRLSSHMTDGFYLGTPYGDGDNRSPNGDISFDGYPAMNCTGFVWYALRDAGAPSWTPAMTGWNALVDNNDIAHYFFSSKADMLAAGVLERGDIIWMWDENAGGINRAAGTHHIGIFWGSSPDDDRLWHSTSNGSLQGNVISAITPLSNNVTYEVIKM